MVSDSTKDAIWNDYFNIIRLVHYYETLSGRFQIFSNAIRLLLLLPLFSAIVLFIDFFQEMGLNTDYVYISMGVLVAILAGLELTLNISKRAFTLHIVSVECSKLEDKWRNLWQEAYADQSNDKTLLEKNARLSELLTDVTSQVVDASDYKWKKLNDECESIASARLKQLYE